MSEGNATLKEGFRHHAWATRELLAFCAQLRPEQLLQRRPAPLAGVHGSILETFDHIVCSDGGYLGALTSHRPAWAHERGLSSDLGELAPRVDEAESLWMGFLSLPDDDARKVFLDDGTYETHAAIVTGAAPRQRPPRADLRHPQGLRPGPAGGAAVGLRGRDRSFALDQARVAAARTAAALGVAERASGAGRHPSDNPAPGRPLTLARRLAAGRSPQPICSASSTMIPSGPRT